jgi:hypothetical protein
MGGGGVNYHWRCVVPEVTGTVTKVTTLDKRGDRDPLRSASIEGISFLIPGDAEAPEEGWLIRANLSTQWKKGKPPLHWLKAFNVLVGGNGRGR